jgi:ABC-type transporter Mla maintaining outer membrane lipid asymmetry ATPase subunit MlaF
MEPISLRFEELLLTERQECSFSLDISAHLTVSIVGDDGSGIDRLGRFILGLERPPGGRVYVDGQEISLMPRKEALAFRRGLGYLPAGDGLLQNLSLQENVALPLRFGSNLSERDISGRVKVILAAARISAAAHLRPVQANPEQRRRAALARALAFDPDLVLLEQPFAGLTNRAAREVLEIARGGDVAEGSRRSVLATGHSLPQSVSARFDTVYRATGRELQQVT